MKKICSQCSIEKPQEDFYSTRNKCKVCYLGNKKKFVKNNPEKVREGKRKYYRENRDKILEQKKEYRKRNRPTIRDYQREYMKKYITRKLASDEVFKIKYVMRKLIAYSLWLVVILRNHVPLKYWVSLMMILRFIWNVSL